MVLDSNRLAYPEPGYHSYASKFKENGFLTRNRSPFFIRLGLLQY